MGEVSMFVGAFILIAGVISLLENMGVITSDVKWGVPLAIICFGASSIYEAWKNNKKN